MSELDKYERVRNKSVNSSSVKNIKINGETYVNKKYLLSKARLVACSSILGLSLVISGITIGSAIKNINSKEEDTIVFDNGNDELDTDIDVTPVVESIPDTVTVEEEVEKKPVDSFENNTSDLVQEDIQNDNIEVEENIEDISNSSDDAGSKEDSSIDNGKLEEFGKKTVDVIENTGEAIEDYKNSDKFGAEFIRDAEGVAEDAGKKIIDNVGMDNIENFGKKTVDVIENTGEAITDYKNSDKFGAEFIRDAESAVEDFGRDVIGYFQKK